MKNVKTIVGRKDDAGGKPDPAQNKPESHELDAKSVQSMIEGAVTKAIEGLNLGDQAEAIKKAVAEAMAEAKAIQDGKANAEAVANAVKLASDKIAEANRKAAKNVAAAEDADKGRQVEIPTSGCKGNLPVWGKQLLNVCLHKDMNEGIDAADLKKAEDHGDRMHKNAILHGAKALTSTGSTSGDEFVPTDLASELQRRLYLNSALAQLMLAREIQMPTNPYNLPLRTTRPSYLLEATENTAATNSDAGTAATVLTAAKFMALSQASYEVDEDSIVPIIPFMVQELAESGAQTWESVIINGDTTATHQDTDTAAITKAPEKAFKGFRKLALAVAALNTDISSGGISRANLVAMRKALGKYGRNVQNLAWIVGPQTAADLENLDEVVTIDKIGNRATILTGGLSALWGIPIIVSESNREDLNASGVNDGVTTTKGSILLVNLSRFLVGSRRGFTVETDRNIKAQTHEIVASFRRAFSPIETPSATVPSLHIGYNYTA